MNIPAIKSRVINQLILIRMSDFLDSAIIQSKFSTRFILQPVNTFQRFVKEETPIIQYDHCGQCEQQNRLDNLAIRVCSKYLVEVHGGNMKDNCNRNITTCFIVEPVHQQHKRNNAYQEIRTVYPAGLNKITLIITFYGGYWHMPDTPERTKK